MKIYTKTGDNGTTGLFSGERVSKNDPRIDLYGTLDELQASITLAAEFNPPNDVKKDLELLKDKLYLLCADFATSLDYARTQVKRFDIDDIIGLEQKIDEYNALMPEQHSFVVPGGNKCSAFINLSRTICRRAERLAISIPVDLGVNEFAKVYINRLSDFLFILMRYVKENMQVV